MQVPEMGTRVERKNGGFRQYSVCLYVCALSLPLSTSPWHTHHSAADVISLHTRHVCGSSFYGIVCVRGLKHLPLSFPLTLAPAFAVRTTTCT